MQAHELFFQYGIPLLGVGLAAAIGPRTRARLVLAGLLSGAAGGALQVQWVSAVLDVQNAPSLYAGTALQVGLLGALFGWIAYRIAARRAPHATKSSPSF